MAINPDNITTIRVDQLADDTLTLDSLFPHTVGTELKSSTIQELVDLVATAVGVTDGVGFLPETVTDGQTLPAIPTNPSFILVGAGTYVNLNGFPDLICTEALNAIMSLSDHWEIAVEIPITPLSGTVQTVTGVNVDNTDPLNPIVNNAVDSVNSQTGVVSIDLESVLTEGDRPIKVLNDFAPYEFILGDETKFLYDDDGEDKIIPPDVFPIGAVLKVFANVSTINIVEGLGVNIFSGGTPSNQVLNIGELAIITLVNGTNDWFFNKIGYSSPITIDAVPTDGSSNAVSSNGVFDALALKTNKNRFVFQAKTSITGVTGETNICSFKIDAGAYSNTDAFKFDFTPIKSVTASTSTYKVYIGTTSGARTNQIMQAAIATTGRSADVTRRYGIDAGNLDTSVSFTANANSGLSASTVVNTPISVNMANDLWVTITANPTVSGESHGVLMASITPLA